MGREGTCPPQEDFNKTLSPEMTQPNHKIEELEEKLIRANENFRLVERDLSETVQRAENAEKGLCSFKEETKKLKQQLYVHCEENKLEKMKLEEQNAAAEHKASVAEKNMSVFRSDLIKITNRAVGAEKEHLDARHTVKLLETELRDFQQRTQKAEEELANAQKRFSNQKEDLIKRANCAEGKLVNVKDTVQAAEIKIQSVEQKFEEVEDALCEVKVEADEKIAELKQKLTCSMERAERELYKFHEKFKVAGREVQKANDRVEVAEKGMLTLKQAKWHTENVLKESLARAERKAQEATAKLHRVEKVLANGKGGQNAMGNYVLNSTGSVYELQNLPVNPNSEGAKAVTTLVIAEENRHSFPAMLQSRDELNKLERILNGCMESTRAHLTQDTSRRSDNREYREYDGDTVSSPHPLHLSFPLIIQVQFL